MQGPTFNMRLHKRLLLMRHRLCTTVVNQINLVLARNGDRKGHQQRRMIDKPEAIAKRKPQQRDIAECAIAESCKKKCTSILYNKPICCQFGQFHESDGVYGAGESIEIQVKSKARHERHLSKDEFRPFRIPKQRFFDTRLESISPKNAQGAVHRLRCVQCAECRHLRV